MKRSEPFRADFIHIDRTRGSPLHRQISLAFRQAISSGAIAPGTPLPSSRTLARQLGVSRNTVTAACQDLAEWGLVTARSGSGTRVRNAPQLPALTIGDLGRMLRHAHYPSAAVRISDPDGNVLLAHR